MGQSSSTRRRRRRRNDHHQHPPPPPPPNPNPNPNFYSSNPNSYNSHPYSSQLSSGYNNLVLFLDSLVRRPPPRPAPPYYAPNQANGPWVSPYQNPPSSSSSSSLPPAPQYVEHEQAKTVKNEVNVHKGTIRLDVDDGSPGCHLVSFVFDALVDGSVTIYYFAKEGVNCNFLPMYEDMYTPTRFPFNKGLGQKFCQPSGSGIDLGFFELDDLSKPLHGDIFPLVIYAEASSLRQPTNEQVEQSTVAGCAQITQAVIEKTNDGPFHVKVVKQILWVNGQRYELQEIFGIVDSAEAEPGGEDADDMGKECVICLSESRNTAVLPCRHMCLCSECAKALRLQSNKCPICRQPVEKLMEIKVNNDK